MVTHRLLYPLLFITCASGPLYAGAEDFSRFKQGDFTSLKSPLGHFKAKSGAASINSKSADQTPGSLRINGGSKREVVLELASSLQKPLLYLQFNGERWTGANPFSFSIEGKQANKWKKVYHGDKLPLRQLDKTIHVDLKGESFSAFRFSATTKKDSGVLLDNLQIVPDGDMEIKGLTAQQLQIPSLIRGGKTPLLSFNLSTEGSKKADTIQEVVISTDGTSALGDIQSYTLYLGKNGASDVEGALEVGKHAAAKKLVFNFQQELRSGANRYFLVPELSGTADLSHRVVATLASVQLAKAGVLRPSDKGEPTRQRIGYNVAHSGDVVVRTDGSSMECKRMRIPGMVTSNEGSLLAVYDLRWKQNGDLPGDIDVGLSRSTDGGKTWEAPRPVLDMGEWLGQPENKNGVGDPAILVDRKTGHIYITGLVAHGLSSGWYWGKSKPGMDPKDTGQVVIVKSEDDGKTWSKPRNLTPEIKNPEWQLMLQGPGAGITTRDGTLVFAFQYKENLGTASKPRYSARSSILYSKDHGETWTVAPGVDYPQETTEAQVVELNDGSLMLNCRISAGGRAVFTTSDLGKTWKQHPTSGRGTFNMSGCMASILRYSSTKDGDKQDILLFSGPADGGKKRRSHMSIRYSLDEGETWSDPYLLDEIGGAYSCLSLVHDGDRKDIGIIYEGSQSNMTFERLTLDELMGKTGSQ
ncbi:exo-alpha-sialidase [Verrucomicrobiaceae bacterium N1E253]|uniref:exo-alpha-sialidase n=1 Tax=Oceaniferula marina TaxID=2748318 RepID=A0A851GBI2_9BACT|nr:sialidase family protein [Oceaniferula marina]NWK54302.1 exo-alpha-sialidase [Oceaniferula marina]